MKQILAVGADPSLLYTRGLLLERSGAAVTTTTCDQALPLLAGSTFTLLVLCHSLSDREVCDVCLAARRGGGRANILLLETPGGALRNPVEVDGRFTLDEGPQLFIRTVESLLAEPAESSRAGANIVPFPDATARAARKPLVEERPGSPFAGPLASARGKI